MESEIDLKVLQSGSRYSHDMTARGSKGFVAHFAQAVQYDNFEGDYVVGDWNINIYVEGNCVINCPVPNTDGQGISAIQGRVERLYGDFLTNPSGFNQNRIQTLLDLPFREPD